MEHVRHTWSTITTEKAICSSFTKQRNIFQRLIAAIVFTVQYRTIGSSGSDVIKTSVKVIWNCLVMTHTPNSQIRFTIRRHCYKKLAANLTKRNF